MRRILLPTFLLLALASALGLVVLVVPRAAFVIKCQDRGGFVQLDNSTYPAPMSCTK